MNIADSDLHVQCIYQFTGLHQQRVFTNLGAFLWKWDALHTPSFIGSHLNRRLP